MAGNCPSGGLWYTCTAQNPKFFGCCTSDPCNGHGCPLSNLRPAGLDAGGKSMFPNVSCDSGGKWYTCSETHPTFQGCCSLDPCAKNGCPQDSLRMASFGKDGASKGGDGDGKSQTVNGGSTTQVFTTTIVSSVGNSIPSTLVLTSTLLPQPTSSTSISNGPSSTPDANANAEYLVTPHHNAGKVAGIAVGAVGGVVLVGALIFGWTWLQKRRRNKARNPRLSGGPGSLGGNVIVNVGGVGERRPISDDERIHRSYVEKLEREG